MGADSLVADRALAALRRIVTVDWRDLSQAQAKDLLIRTAQAGHERIMREQAMRAGFIPEWEAYANSPGNTNLQSVRLPGPIVYKYRYLRELVVTAIRELQAISPVDSGRYRNSHTLYINGQPQALGYANIKSGDEVWITNPVPYARRLEVGKTQTGRDFLISVPNRIYERMAKQILPRRFRNTAAFEFGYVTLPGAWKIKGRLPPTYPIGVNGTKHRKRRQNIGEPVRAPAIFIKALS